MNLSALLAVAKAVGAPKAAIDHIQKHIDYAGSDPSKYPASVEVTDDDGLLLLSRIVHQTDEVERVLTRVKLMVMELEMTKGRFFQHAKDTYPEVFAGPKTGYRYLKSGDKWWYVAYPECDGQEHFDLFNLTPGKDDQIHG